MVSRHYDLWHLIWMAEVLGGECSRGNWDRWQVSGSIFRVANLLWHLSNAHAHRYIILIDEWGKKLLWGILEMTPDKLFSPFISEYNISMGVWV